MIGVVIIPNRRSVPTRSMGLVCASGVRRGVRSNAMAYRAIGEHPVHVTPPEFHPCDQAAKQAHGDATKALKAFQFLVSPFVAAVLHAHTKAWSNEHGVPK